MQASYLSIEATTEAQYTQLRSRFIAYAFPLKTEAEALEQIALLKRKYYDARHHCWAYRLGADGLNMRSNDDGEPSGTAGKPILGQILSNNLSNILVVVVRYFGGIKLGTSGLIEAYRTATQEVIANAQIVEHIIERSFAIRFTYELMGEVMRLAKDSGAHISKQEFLEDCYLELSLRADEVEALYTRLSKLYGTQLKWLNEDSQG